MAKVIVEYTAKFKTTLEWPDDEIENLDYDNLQVNLTPSEDDWDGDELEICDLKLNGKDHSF